VRGQLAAVLVVGLALATAAAGCGSGGPAKIKPARDAAKTGDIGHGATLYLNGTGGQLACAFCHTLKAARVVGPFGPDLDSEGNEYVSVHLSDRQIRKLVLDFLVEGRCIDPTDPSRCMPKDLVRGEDAIDMATYIARCAAHEGRPECRPDESAAAGDSRALAGLRLYRSLGCVGCHSMTGNEAVGPTFKGLAGSKVKLDDGTTVTADDAYLIESMTNPDRKIVDGWRAGTMAQRFPPGTITLAQAKALVAFIKKLE